MSDLSALVSREALVKALKSLSGRGDVLLDGYKVDRASSGVEGFNSLVLRVSVNYRLPGDDEIKSHVYFVKTMPQFEAQRENMKNFRVFVKEGFVFSHVVPLMAKISAGRVKIPLPACYHCNYGGDSDAFYMEDLLHSGYRAAHRSFLIDGLDYAHCSLVMKGLGRLHALSLAAEKILEPEVGGWIGLFPDFRREYAFFIPELGDPPAPIKNMADSLIQNLKDLSKEVEGLPKEAEASGALGKVLDGVWPTLCRLRETPSDTRCVLSHGDCWMNNMMFRYEEREKGEEVPVDIMFFDLQSSKVCHPSIDLLYLIYLNTRNPFREKHINALIDEYHSSLTENLRILDGSSPPYSLDDLKSDINRKYKTFGYIMCLLFVPVVLLGDEFLLPNAEEVTAENMEEFFDKGNTQQIKFRFHNDPKYRSTVEQIVREFVDMALPQGLESVHSSPLLAHTTN